MTLTPATAPLYIGRAGRFERPGAGRRRRIGSATPSRRTTRWGLRRPKPSQDAAMRNFDDLSEREMLALAISNEEEDSRIFADFADGLIDNYPTSAQVFK
jgi:hypothetical protein